MLWMCWRYGLVPATGRDANLAPGSQFAAQRKAGLGLMTEGRCVSKKTAFLLLLMAATLIFSVAGCSRKETEATSAAPQKDATSSSPAAASRPPRNPLKNAYFGDLHLHTSYSMDAFAFGTRTTPEDSYKYAMGETVEYMGKPQKRITPLDFLAVTDHAEYLGTVRESINPNGPFAKTQWYTTMTTSATTVSAQTFQ